MPIKTYSPEEAGTKNKQYIPSDQNSDTKQIEYESPQNNSLVQDTTPNIDIVPGGTSSINNYIDKQSRRSDYDYDSNSDIIHEIPTYYSLLIKKQQNDKNIKYGVKVLNKKQKETLKKALDKKKVGKFQLKKALFNKGYLPTDIDKFLDDTYTFKVKPYNHIVDEYVEAQLEVGEDPADIITHLGNNDVDVNPVIEQIQLALEGQAENVIKDKEAILNSERYVHATRGMYSRTIGNALDAKNLEDINNDIITKLNDNNIEPRINSNGDIEVKLSDGTWYDLEPGVLDIMRGSMYEITGSAIGAMAGVKYGTRIGSRLGIIGAVGGGIAGGLFGGAIGAGAGSHMDFLQHQIIAKDDLEYKIAFNKAVDAGITDMVYSALFAGSLKVARVGFKQIAKLYHILFQKVSPEVIEMALKKSGLSPQEADDFYKDAGISFNISVKTEKEKLNLLAQAAKNLEQYLAISKTTGHIFAEGPSARYADIREHVEKAIQDQLPVKNINKEISEPSTAAMDKYTEANIDLNLANENLANLLKTNQISGSKIIGSELVDLARNAIKTISNLQDTKKEAAMAITGADKIDLNIIDTVNEVIKGVSHNNFISSELKHTIAYDINEFTKLKGNQTIQHLYGLHNILGNAKIKNVTDKKVITLLQNAITNHINKSILNSTFAKSSPTNMALAQKFPLIVAKTNELYGTLKSIKDVELIKTFTKVDPTISELSEAVKLSAKDTNHSYRTFSKVLDGKSKYLLDAVTLDELIKTHTTGVTSAKTVLNSYSAIDFPSLSKELLQLNSEALFKNPAVTDIVKRIDLYAKVFKNDKKLIELYGSINPDHFKSFLTRNPFVRATYMLSSAVFNAMSVYKPGSRGVEAALVRSISAYVREPLNYKLLKKIDKATPPEVKSAVQQALGDFQKMIEAGSDYNTQTDNIRPSYNEAKKLDPNYGQDTFMGGTPPAGGASSGLPISNIAKGAPNPQIKAFNTNLLRKTLDENIKPITSVKKSPSPINNIKNQTDTEIAIKKYNDLGAIDNPSQPLKPTKREAFTANEIERNLLAGKLDTKDPTLSNQITLAAIKAARSFNNISPKREEEIYKLVVNNLTAVVDKINNSKLKPKNKEMAIEKIMQNLNNPQSSINKTLDKSLTSLTGVLNKRIGQLKTRPQVINTPNTPNTERDKILENVTFPKSFLTPQIKAEITPVVISEAKSLALRASKIKSTINDDSPKQIYQDTLEDIISHRVKEFNTPKAERFEYLINSVNYDTFEGMKEFFNKAKLSTPYNEYSLSKLKPEKLKQIISKARTEVPRFYHYASLQGKSKNQVWYDRTHKLLTDEFENNPKLYNINSPEDTKAIINAEQNAIKRNTTIMPELKGEYKKLADLKFTSKLSKAEITEANKFFNKLVLSNYTIKSSSIQSANKDIYTSSTQNVIQKFKKIPASFARKATDKKITSLPINVENAIIYKIHKFALNQVKNLPENNTKYNLYAKINKDMNERFYAQFPPYQQ